MSGLFGDADIGEVIRALFVELGFVPVRVLAKEVIKRKLLSPEDLARHQLRSVQTLCRQALAVLGKNGVPFAQPTGKHRNDPWQQLEMFTYEQFCDLLTRRAEGIVDDYEKLRTLHTWGTHKYRRPMPLLPYLAELSAV
jgi:hypothetical protein